MSEVIKWHDKAVDVQSRLVPRYLWSTASIDVFLDGQLILSTGGQMKFTGAHSTTFTQGGTTHTAELCWGGSGFGFSFPCQLKIDGVLISTSRVHIRNWQLGIMGVVAMIAVALTVVHHLRASR